MKANYDFTNARPNPYAERMKNGYTIIIDRTEEDAKRDDKVIRKQVEERIKKVLDNDKKEQPK